jgi:hypothetical protein
MGALFLFWPGSGNLAGAVEGGRSARTGERDGSALGAEVGGYPSKPLMLLSIFINRLTVVFLLALGLLRNSI